MANMNYMDVVGGSLGIAESLTQGLAANAKIADTSIQDQMIQSHEAQQYDSSDYDSLMAQYSTGLRTNYSGSELRGSSIGEQLGNTLSSTLGGAMSGATMGPWGAVAGAGAGLLGGLSGIFIGNAKARSEAARLNYNTLKANDINNQKFAQTASNISDKMFNSAALNLGLTNKSAYGGQMKLSGNFNNGVTQFNTGGTHEENPYEGIQQGMDSNGVPNLVEEGEVKWNDYIFSNRLKVPKDLKQKYKLSDSVKTYADAVKKLQKESEERPNDIISKRTLDSILSDVASVQEEQRIREQQRELNNALKQLSPQELMSLGNILGQQQMAEEQAAQQQAMQQMSQEQIPQEQIPADYGALANMQALGGHIGRKYELGSILESPSASTGPLDQSVSLGIAQNNYQVPPLVIPQTQLNTPQSIQNDTLTQIRTTNNIEPSTGISEGGKTPKHNWGAEVLRALPVAGNFVSSLVDAFSPRDYNVPVRLEQKAEQTPHASYKPIGQYMSYRPYDINNIMNLAQAANTGAVRTQRDLAGGNRAAAAANIAALDTSYQKGLGDTFAAAQKYNDERLAKALEFNRGTDQLNAGLRSQALSQELQRAGMINQAYQAAAPYRTALDTRKLDLTNFFDSMGAIGREALDRDSIEALYKSGVFGTGNDAIRAYYNYSRHKNGGKLKKK